MRTKRVSSALIMGITLLTSCANNSNTTAPEVNISEEEVANDLQYCNQQLHRTLAELRDSTTGQIDYTMSPRNILSGESHWNLRKVDKAEWCGGFFPGTLWYDYEATGDTAILREARSFTEPLAFLAETPAYDHDLGFLVITSFLNGYRLTGDEHYKQILLACADTLATLYNPHVGTILSWPRHVEDFHGHNTIMDNMINLELLFWAADNGGSDSLRQIAISHASTTMKHHFRPDGSCYHVAIYDPMTGEFLRGQTHQGYSDDSMWARGQSWAIYGYTTTYRYTKDPTFLEFAQKVTDIYLKRLHETSDDWVPIWDMDDPRGAAAPKDASTACVVASALLELSGYVDARKAGEYRNAAIKMLRDLSTEKYQSREQAPSMLLHSTGHHPAGSEIDASISYADYYYIEALCRLHKLQSE